MPWNAELETLKQGRVVHVRVHRDGSPAAFAEVFNAWQKDAGLRVVFVDVLARAPFPAYFWETPPVTQETVARPFEFVMLDGPALALMDPDPDAFARYFEAAGPDAEVAAFANLGGDAFLVTPTPRAAPHVYPHIAAFARNAAMNQQHAFW